MRIESYINGRVRVVFEAFRGFYLNKEILSGVEGIRGIHFNPRRASLLIEFDEDHLSLDNLLEQLRALSRRDLFSRLPRMRAPLNGANLERESSRDNLTYGDLVLRGSFLVLAPYMPLGLRALILMRGVYPFFRRGIKSIMERRFDLDLLNSLAIGSALVHGKWSTAGAIALFLELGNFLENLALKEVREGEDEWRALDKVKVWVMRDGVEEMALVKELRVGDLIKVRAGALIPVDGVVVKGEALINQSFLTGESVGILKRENDFVYAMSVVEEGELLIRAVKVGESTRAYQIKKLMEMVEVTKAKTQRELERLSEKLVKVVVFLALGFTILTRNIYLGTSLFLVDFSCSLKLSSSLIFFAAHVRARREGVLLKSFSAFEALASANIFVFDKTGTLTSFEPRLVKVIPLANIDERELLRLVACVEEHFPHPVAQTIVREAEKLGLLHPEDHAQVEYVVAHGIVSSYRNSQFVVGSKHFLSDHLGIQIAPQYRKFLRKYEKKGYQILYISWGEELVGLLVLEPLLREEAKKVIDYLKGKAKVLLLTGDSEGLARKVAKDLGIDKWYAELLPEDKAEVIRKLKENGNIIVMIGDGMNDAPALKEADVGISFKRGADLAQIAADIVLDSESLESLIFVKELSEETLRRLKRIYQSSLLINSCLMAGLLFNWLSPVVSVLLHNMTTLIAASYALYLRRWENDNK